MQDKYSAMDITNDAVAFAASRFGKHYLKRLETNKRRELDIAMNSNYSDSYRAHAATKAAAMDKELDYFATAARIKADPNLLQRLIAKTKPKAKEDTPIV
jgi:hypothetical protein